MDSIVAYFWTPAKPGGSQPSASLANRPMKARAAGPNPASTVADPRIRDPGRCRDLWERAGNRTLREAIDGLDHLKPALDV